MKVLLGVLIHETNTFSSVKTTVETFKQWDLNYGDDVITKHRGVAYYLGGMIDECDAHGIEYVPTVSAMARPSGYITADTYDQLKHDLIEAIKKENDYDAVCLSLHGAGVVEGIDDMEGDFLKSVRETIGYDIPVVVSLDLHANMTEQMVKEADVLVGNVLYPHSDSYEIGREAVAIAKNLVEGKIKPTAHIINLPLIIPTYTTEKSPMVELNEACARSEEIANVIDCTIYHGFPYTDIEQMGVSVLVTTDNDPDLAKEEAKKIADDIWKVKDEFFTKHPSPEEGLKLALEHDGYPVVINETSDNPGAGTPGDGTYLLKAMLEAQIEKSCFGNIYDPEVAQIAHEAGPGSYIDVTLGGKVDQLHGEPLTVRAYVKSITDGQYVQSSPMARGDKVNLGKSARLVINGVDVLVASINTQVKDEQFFLLHGINVNEYKVVGIKSSNHFRAGFNPIASKIITVDSPGLSTFDLSVFNYTKVKNKSYPIHELESVAF